MGRILGRLGRLIVFSRRHNCVRRGVLFLGSNFLLFVGCIFAAEVLLIFLGVAGVCLPINTRALSFLTRFFY